MFTATIEETRHKLDDVIKNQQASQVTVSLLEQFVNKIEIKIELTYAFCNRIPVWEPGRSVLIKSLGGPGQIHNSRPLTPFYMHMDLKMEAEILRTLLLKISY